MHESIIDKAGQSKSEVWLSFHNTFSIFARWWWSDHTPPALMVLWNAGEASLTFNSALKGTENISQLQGGEAEPQPRARGTGTDNTPRLQGLIQAAFPISDSGWISEGNSLLCLTKYDRANHRYSSCFPIQNYQSTTTTKSELPSISAACALFKETSIF